MKRALIVALVVAAFVFVTLIVFGASRSTAVSPASPASPVAPVSNQAAPQAAPDFALRDLNGHPVHLSDLRGKVVVVNFWATWCPPCREEIPSFIDLQKKYGPNGLTVVGLSMDSGTAADVARFAKENGINYTVAMADNDTAARYGGVSVLPSTFYIGRDGKVIRYVPGLIAPGEMEQIITTALAAPAHAAAGARS